MKRCSSLLFALVLVLSLAAFPARAAAPDAASSAPATRAMLCAALWEREGKPAAAATGQGEAADGDYTFQPADKVVFDGSYYLDWLKTLAVKPFFPLESDILHKQPLLLQPRRQLPRCISNQ